MSTAAELPLREGDHRIFGTIGCRVLRYRHRKLLSHSDTV
jgi:hypothetical protein